MTARFSDQKNASRCDLKKRALIERPYNLQFRISGFEMKATQTQAVAIPRMSSLLFAVVFFGRRIHQGLRFDTRAIQLHDLVEGSQI